MYVRRVAKFLANLATTPMLRFEEKLVTSVFSWLAAKVREEELLTYQIIGRDDDATGEQNSAGDSVVRPEDHVIDDRLVHQVSYLDEPGHRRDQPKHRHCSPRSTCSWKRSNHILVMHDCR